MSIEITKDNYTDYLDLPIAAFSIASPGAQGEMGGVYIVTIDGKTYHTNYLNRISDEELLQILPDIKERMYDFPFSVKLDGWHTEYMGGGNVLFVRNPLWEDVRSESIRIITEIRETGRYVILYNVWKDAVLKVLETTTGSAAPSGPDVGGEGAENR